MTPQWSPDGNRLYFRNGEKLMVVEVKDRRSFATSKPRVLFEKALFACDNYDVAPDGEHFLMCKEPSPAAPKAIDIITDWSSLLRE